MGKNCIYIKIVYIAIILYVRLSVCCKNNRSMQRGDEYLRKWESGRGLNIYIYIYIFEIPKKHILRYIHNI